MMTIRVKGISLSLTGLREPSVWGLGRRYFSVSLISLQKIETHTTHNSKTTLNQRMKFIGWTQMLDGTTGRRGAFFTDVCAKLVET